MSVQVKRANDVAEQPVGPVNMVNRAAFETVQSGSVGADPNRIMSFGDYRRDRVSLDKIALWEPFAAAQPEEFPLASARAQIALIVLGQGKYFKIRQLE